MLELKNICFSAGGKEILKNIDLEIDGGFNVVTGPNGSGKSTLARIIAGMEKPDSGRIILDGCDITDMSITDRARAGVGFAFQQPVRFKGLTVRDLVSIATGNPDTDVSYICDILSNVGLCARDYIGRELNSELSGGELKRIEIAMTIARKTKFTIFDEPEAGIDLWSFGSLIRVFENLRRDVGGSMLIISHQERILDIADRIIVIADGRVCRSGTRDEILPTLLDTKAVCDKLSDKL